MLLIITSNNDKLFIGVNINDFEWPWTPKIKVLVFFCNLSLRRRFQEWISSKWIEIDQDNLRIETAKAVARLINYAQISCTIAFHRLTTALWIEQIRETKSCVFSTDTSNFRQKKNQKFHFLRATAECFARLCHRLGICLSVCPSVCHTRELYQNGAS